MVHLMPKTKDLKPHISISIHASLREAKHLSGSASALFVGGFSMLQMGKVTLFIMFNIQFLFFCINTNSIDLCLFDLLAKDSKFLL